MTALPWQKQVQNLLPSGAQIDLVISPDVDGLLSASAVLHRGPTRIVGIYSTKHIVLLGGATEKDAENAVWLDHDVSRPNIRCIGQHLTLHDAGDKLPLRSTNSFNPNNFVGQTYRDSFRGVTGKKRDKYPFGTVHFLRHALSLPVPTLNSEHFNAVAHADGSWGTSCDYAFNCHWWRDNFFVNDPFINDLTNHFVALPAALTRHASLIADLASAGVGTRLARMKTSLHIPTAWQLLEGHQSVTFKVIPTSNVILQSLEKNAASLRRVAAVLQARTQEQIPTIAAVTDYISGTYVRIYPNQVPYGGFDDFMVGQKIFSHAFTSQRELKYTTGLY